MKTQSSVAGIHARVDWRALRITAEVAKTGSLKRAATNLNLTESTVSRYVTALEKQLGVVLFERSSGGMTLTDPGERLIRRLYQAEAQVEAGLESAIERQSTAEGNVRLTAVPIIANRVLARQAPDLISKYPDLELELIGIPTDLSMLRREADVALRLARPAKEMDALTRKIGVLEYSVYMLRDEASNRPFTDPKDVPWVTYGHRMSNLPHAKWLEDFGKKSGETASNLKFHDAEGLISAALAGTGKVLLPRIVADKIAELVELSGYDALPKRDVWLLIHPNIANTERVQVVVSWVEKIFTHAVPRAKSL